MTEIISPKYRLLTDKQIQTFIESALRLLENTGIRFNHPKALALLNKHGCTIRNENIVLFQRELIIKTLKTVPSQIDIYSRDGKLAMELTGRNTYFGTGTDLIRTYDLKTQKYRLTVLEDVKNAAKVSDYCQDVDFVSSFGLPSDVERNLAYFENVRTLVHNTTKPIFFTAAGVEDLKYIAEMAFLIAGTKEKFQKEPFIIHYSEPTAPLTQSFSAIEKLMFCAENKIPICYTPGDILGASCPVSLAGGITQALAEILSSITFHQICNSGAPMISGFAVVPIDMKTSVFCYGAPDWRLTNSAFADIMHYFNIPMWSTVGSDTFVLDEQAGIEHGIGTLMAVLDGANLIHDIGYLGQGLLGNPAAILMSDEIISYVKRIKNGFELSDEKIALDIIAKVGHGGSFLQQKHTLKNFRNELWRPKDFNRDTIESWQEKGALTYNQRITNKALNIIENHKPTPLSPNITGKIEKIAERAYTELKNYHFRT